MAINAYAKIGGYKGDSTQAGDKNEKFTVYKIDHKVELPVDPQTGQPTGNRIHGPFSITIPKCAGGVEVKKAMCSAEPEKLEVVISHFNPQKTTEIYYEITLTDAIVCKIEDATYDTLDPKYTKYPDLEKVSFTYSKIKWTDKVDNKEHEDSWENA